MSTATPAARRPLGATGIEVSPLCLGTNSLGWTADEETSHAVLDAYVAGGGNFLDTANIYSAWGEGNQGGESETIIGNWIRARGRHDDLVVATKVGMAGGRFPKGLAADQIRRGAEQSLTRLGIDRIDLFYSHEDDPDTPQTETAQAMDALVREGLVRAIGASNFTAERLESALRIADREGVARYAVVQPAYNLLNRDGFEGPLQQLCLREGIAVAPYPALAGGLLTGKYRDDHPTPSTVRSGAALAARAEPRTQRVLESLESLARAIGSTPGRVAIAWLVGRDGVAAALASASRPEQVADLLSGVALELGPQAIAALDQASRT